MTPEEKRCRKELSEFAEGLFLEHTKLAIKALKKMVSPNMDTKSLLFGAWLHDIGQKYGEKDHAERSLEMSQD